MQHKIFSNLGNHRRGFWLVVSRLARLRFKEVILKNRLFWQRQRLAVVVFNQPQSSKWQWNQGSYEMSGDASAILWADWNVCTPISLDRCGDASAILWADWNTDAKLIKYLAGDASAILWADRNSSIN